MKKAQKPSFHESYEREEEIVGSSDRSFGIVFTVVFTVIGLWPLLGANPPRWWSLAIAAAILAVSLLRPGLLARPNKLWMRFGLLLHKVTNPIIMGLLFFVVMTPMGLGRRLFVRDPMNLKRREDLESYWVSRDEAQRASSMEKQF